MPEETKTHRVPVDIYLNSLADLVEHGHGNGKLVANEIRRCASAVTHTKILVEYESIEVEHPPEGVIE